MASIWRAKETGGFAKEGLDVEMISVSSTFALPALLVNELNVIQIFAVPLINPSPWETNRGKVLQSHSVAMKAATPILTR